MTFVVRLVVVGLSAFVTANLAASAALPVLLKRRLPGVPAERASRLLRARLFPATLALAGMLLSMSSFVVFEPRAYEAIGLVLPILAAAAALILVISSLRVLHIQIATARVLRGWMRTAEPVTLPGVRIPAFAVRSRFPIVALVGVWRPRMVIARSVLDACTAEELSAIFAHEHGHLLHRDNAKRALFMTAPDVLGWLPFSRRLADDWHDATEAAADDFAGASAPNGRLRLAEALIRVARLAPAGQPAPYLPASALYRGENIEGRVRRLVDDRMVTPTGPIPLWTRLLTTLAFLSVSAVALKAIWELVETAVTNLP